MVQWRSTSSSSSSPSRQWSGDDMSEIILAAAAAAAWDRDSSLQYQPLPPFPVQPMARSNSITAGGMPSMAGSPLQQRPHLVIPPGHEQSRSLCKYWRAGRCWYGNQCRFQHPGPDGCSVPPSCLLLQRHSTLRLPLPGSLGLPSDGAPAHSNMAHIPLCRHYLRNRCKYGAFCRFRHELTETEACVVSGQTPGPGHTIGPINVQGDSSTDMERRLIDIQALGMLYDGRQWAEDGGGGLCVRRVSPLFNSMHERYLG